MTIKGVVRSLAAIRSDLRADARRGLRGCATVDWNPDFRKVYRTGGGGWGFCASDSQEEMRRLARRIVHRARCP